MSRLLPAQTRLLSATLSPAQSSSTGPQMLSSMVSKLKTLQVILKFNRKMFQVLIQIVQFASMTIWMTSERFMTLMNQQDCFPERSRISLISLFLTPDYLQIQYLHPMEPGERESMILSSSRIQTVQYLRNNFAIKNLNLDISISLFVYGTIY